MGWGGKHPSSPASLQPARSQAARPARMSSAHAVRVGRFPYQVKLHPSAEELLSSCFELAWAFEGPPPSRVARLNTAWGESHQNQARLSACPARLVNGTGQRRLALFACSGTFQFRLQKLRVAVLVSIVLWGAARNRVWGADRKKKCPESLPPALRHSACRQAHAGSTTPAQRLTAVSG